MPTPQTRLGLYGGPTSIFLGAAPPPVLTVAFALQCAGLPQQFPDAPQERHLDGGNVGFQLQVQVLDADGNVLNLAAATGVELLLTWPGGERQVVPAAFVTNGTDGQVGAALGNGLGGGWGLYWVRARATFSNQVLETQGGRLWYGWVCQ
ncbi:MAG: hypothetical protein PHS14_00130 [Elusimicrobia bacterium]|nr:hypothetical protein [Elusimicrobiota bacterium]